MMKILAIFFFVIMFVVIILGSILKGVINIFTPQKKYKTNDPYANQSKANDSSDVEPKKFPNTEGEYVSYEEIKEE